MNQLSKAKRTQIIAALVEGMSIRATCRMTGAAKNTVIKLLCDVGAACKRYQDRVMRNLPCTRLECDEIWQFVYAKAKNVPYEKITDAGIGDTWTWVAICADTKLVPTWWIGGRDAGTAERFIRNLADRLANRVQLTTDGHQPYIKAVDSAFGDDIDYAMLQKLYGPDSNPNKPESKYSPGKCNGSRRRRIKGQPVYEHVHELRRTAEPHDANVDATVHEIDQRLQQEGRESRARGRAPLHALQLLPEAHDAQ